MSGKYILGIKRKSNYITETSDLIKCNDVTLGIGREIFFLDFSKKNPKVELYQNNFKDVNICCPPDFIRGDDIIVYINIFHNDQALRLIDDSTIDSTMEILKLTSTILYTIHFSNNVILENMNKLISNYRITEKIYNFNHIYFFQFY